MSLLERQRGNRAFSRLAVVWFAAFALSEGLVLAADAARTPPGPEASILAERATTRRLIAARKAQILAPKPARIVTPPTPVVDIAANDEAIETVVAAINSQIPAVDALKLFGKVSGTCMTVSAEKEPLDVILNRMTKPNNWVWWRSDAGNYGMADREYYARNLVCCGASAMTYPTPRERAVYRLRMRIIRPLQTLLAWTQ
ncbi:hypothetical protein BH09SUM1_BH09SUM1_25790 [soil metagenome]